MAAARVLPDIQTDYATWSHDIDLVLSSMDMERGAWQANWPYNFHRDFNLGVTPRDAALHACDFWWQHVYDESWS